jgi:hypothetical protein
MAAHMGCILGGAPRVPPQFLERKFKVWLSLVVPNNVLAEEIVFETQVSSWVKIQDL